MYNFHLFPAALYYLVRRGKNYLISGVFLNVICYSIKKNGNSVVVGFVLSSEVKNKLILLLSLVCVVLECET